MQASTHREDLHVQYGRRGDSVRLQILALSIDSYPLYSPHHAKWHGARHPAQPAAPRHYYGAATPHRTRMVCPRVASWLRRLLLFDLPPSLALFYFLNSCVQSLPLTANQGWLLEELAMPQPTVNLYYAVTFMPWSLKPLYALLADCFPLCGFHFRPWLAISSAGSACCYVLAGVYVETIGGAFLVALVRAICNACAEFMLGAVLVNEARGSLP